MQKNLDRAHHAPSLSCVMPAYNEDATLPRVVPEVLQALRSLSPQVELILVNDGSTDGTRAWLATLKSPHRVILNERNLGYAGANNRAATVARELKTARTWLHRELRGSR